jgi:hypothetical protein
MTKEERLQDIIDNTNDGIVLSWWNQRCDDYRDDERFIYTMDDFNDCFYGMKPIQIAEAIENAYRFSSCDEYWVNGIYGIESFDDVYDVMDDDELIEYIIDEDEDFGDDRIRDVLDAEEEEEEEADEE